MGVIIDNPILWREAVPRPLRRARPWHWVGLTLLIALLPVAIVLVLGDEETSVLGYVLIWIWALCTILIGMMHTCRSIVQERVQGTWDLLVLSRLRPHEIVFGKLLAALLPSWTLGFLLLPTAVCLIAMSRIPEPYLPLLYGYIVAVVGGAAAASLGLYCSMRCASVGNAQLLAFMIAFVTYAMTAIVMGVAVPVLAFGTESMILLIVVATLVLLTPGIASLADLLYRFYRLDGAHRGAGQAKPPAPGAEGS